MEESATFFDDRSNPDDPQHARVMRQQEIFEAWSERAGSFRPSFQHFSEDLKAILPVSIYEMYGVNRADLALPIISDPFLLKIQHLLVSAYDKRDLHFSLKDLHAIANPDEPEENPERVLYQGCFNLMGDTCYKMDVPILLTKQQDEDAFDFFFVLKLAKLPLVEIDSFLEYHRAANFDGDTELFCRYLSVLMDGLHEIAGFDAVQVSESQSKIIEEWCNLQLSQRAANSLQVNKDDWGELESFHSEMSIAAYRKLIAYFGRYPSLKKERVPRSRIKASTIEPSKKFLQLLNETDIELLQDVGLSLPSKIGKKIEPNLGIGDMSLLYFFFHFIWQHNTNSLTSGRKQMALYVNSWFQLESVVTPDALRKHNVSTDFKEGLEAIWDKR